MLITVRRNHAPKRIKKMLFVAQTSQDEELFYAMKQAFVYGDIDACQAMIEHFQTHRQRAMLSPAEETVNDPVSN